METLYLLVPLSLLLVVFIIGVLWWAVQNGQYDDMDSAGHSVLMDDDSPGGHGDGAKPPSVR